MNKKLVSVIIPVYNSEKYIWETIRSVQQQTYQNIEIILVNDKSTDKSLEIIKQAIKDFNIEATTKIIDLTENQGVANARNSGVEVAQGEFICFLDSDDLWKNEKVTQQMQFMLEKQVAFSFTGYEFLTSDGQPTGHVVQVPELLNYKQALGNTTIFTSTVMFDINRIDKNLLFMKRIPSEDTALWWKLIKLGHLAYGLNKNLVGYRRSENTLSANKLQAIKRIWYLYRKEEKLNLVQAIYYFSQYAFRAMQRRIG